jgi:hypothetical protein
MSTDFAQTAVLVEGCVSGPLVNQKGGSNDV